MSRSKRKNLVSPNACCNSQKSWKQDYNRTYRRKSKELLSTAIDENGNILKEYNLDNVKKQDYANDWNSPSDGKHRVELKTPREFLEIKQLKYTNRYSNLSDYNDYLDWFKKTFIYK